MSDNHGYLAIFEWFNIRIQTVISVFGVASNRVAAASPFEVILPSFAATSLRTHCPDFYHRLLTNCLHQDFLKERLCMETSQDRKFSQNSHRVLTKEDRRSHKEFVQKVLTERALVESELSKFS